MNYWIIKTEPSTYSVENLKKDGKTRWDGIRNFQARNFIRAMNPGDKCVVYHSGKDKSAMGIATIISKPYADPTTKEDWSTIDLQFESTFPVPVTLTKMKADPTLKSMLLIRQSRLSVAPLTPIEFNKIHQLAEGSL